MNFLVLVRHQILLDCLIIAAISLSFSAVLKSHFLSNPVYDFGKSVNYIVPFFVGVILRKYGKVKTFVETNVYLWLILFCALFITRYHYFFIQFQHQIDGFLSISGSFLVWAFFAGKRDGHFYRTLTFVGQNTLEIYVLHVFFVFNIVKIGEWWLICNPFLCISSQVLYALLQSIVAIALSVCVAGFLKRSKVISSLMFGTQV